MGYSALYLYKYSQMKEDKITLIMKHNIMKFDYNMRGNDDISLTYETGYFHFLSGTQCVEKAVMLI